MEIQISSDGSLRFTGTFFYVGGVKGHTIKRIYFKHVPDKEQGELLKYRSVVTPLVTRKRESNCIHETV